MKWKYNNKAQKNADRQAKKQSRECWFLAEPFSICSDGVLVGDRRLIKEGHGNPPGSDNYRTGNNPIKLKPRKPNQQIAMDSATTSGTLSSCDQLQIERNKLGEQQEPKYMICSARIDRTEETQIEKSDAQLKVKWSSARNVWTERQQEFTRNSLGLSDLEEQEPKSDEERAMAAVKRQENFRGI